MGIDFSEPKLKEATDRYLVLVCENCKAKLEKNMLPIKERMDEGKPPRFADMRKLMQSLCPRCFQAVVKEQSKKP